MAAKVKSASSVVKIDKPKVSRPGVHAKSKTSNLKSSKNYKKLYRNFINTSWIYNDLPLNNNKLMSRFGSRNMLKHEIDLININNINISDFRHQCMHDMLVMMGISTSEHNY